MFRCFFPNPRVFFPSCLLFVILCIALWYGGARDLGRVMEQGGADQPGMVGISLFWSWPYLWFYAYFWLCSALLAAVCQLVAPHRWWAWSILGSALVIFSTWLQVQVSVAINDWSGPFYNLVQKALSSSGQVTLGQIYGDLLVFGEIALAAVTMGMLTAFFSSHYVFRWRSAMNEFYAQHWQRLRLIEGAAQRVQEDTMRFATTMEDLGVSLINAVLTLIAFLPVLATLGAHITMLPLIGHVPHALVVAAVAWSLFGTLFLALIGIRLPGLQFANQRVEAAYRKELVYGEDDPSRAQPQTLTMLFADVRRNYVRLYLHYTYFNLGKILYLQVDNIFGYIILAPTIIAGAITLGLLQQILNAFDQVRSSLQYLVNSWTTIVELTSIYKRLRAFETAMP
ncbi:peptide antibiotic transporter SbmA [Novosphingobium terrae]|uniref:peptide antibiotic transporter SbmA n=1 Tax=Novosphingobium terrae TaxID=2726189 RepID=UPI0019801821|nr:peptide antibiotic transporter SbmA [Novosphingobium terrae]